MLITVFTPTYNRARLLPRLHKSLQEQTNKDFEWVIVDDGSTDNTKEVIENITIQQENDFPIRYFYKENGGKHTAINKGVKEAKGELFFIADSDDALLPNSLEIVRKNYLEIKENKNIGGICGLDCYKDGKLVGSKLPKETLESSSIEIRNKYRVIGDLKEVFYTDVMKEFPFPEIDNERFVPEDLVWNRIAQKYKLRCINQSIYQVEYQKDGLTAEIIKIRMKSPIATTMCYAEMLDLYPPIKDKVKAAINYWRFYFCIEDKSKIRKRINSLWIWLLPIGWAFHIKDRIRTAKR
ncbi:glycosyltransferase family 2 protein [Prevotella falsenii]|uniref:glycosyltransferase family 2 protein n=1 Tax=Prevotella falsenii TaxID=515414 RepID=UPI0004680DC8|nr:glycosyltransferase family A protein [Prevotella falsenii]